MAMPTLIVKKLTAVMEKLFSDLADNFESAARNCRNNDASTALGEAASAVHMMDIPWLIREALEMPHDDSVDIPIIPDFKV